MLTRYSCTDSAVEVPGLQQQNADADTQTDDILEFLYFPWYSFTFILWREHMTQVCRREGGELPSVLKEHHLTNTLLLFYPYIYFTDTYKSVICHFLTASHKDLTTYTVHKKCINRHAASKGPPKERAAHSTHCIQPLHFHINFSKNKAKKQKML